MPISPEGPFLGPSAALHVVTEALAGLQNGESARRMDLGGTCDRMKKRPALFGWRQVNREFMKRVVRREKAWPVDRILQNTLDEIRHGGLPVMQDHHKNIMRPRIF